MAAKKGQVDAEKFVRAWQSASSTAEVARSLGVTPNTCTVRAARFRRLGVPLKKFCEPLDYAALIKIAKAEGK